jgi:hypothetical protein
LNLPINCNLTEENDPVKNDIDKTDYPGEGKVDPTPDVESKYRC